MPSRAMLSRLPKYLDHVRSVSGNVWFISAARIAGALGLGEVRVRQDLASICEKGKPKTGYSVSDLREALEAVLGVHKQYEAIIVGAGRLGTALLGFGGFSDYGIKVRRAFDNNPKAVSSKILLMDELPSYCSLNQVDIGIITVPTFAAQQVADSLVKCGIRAIWCFAVCELEVPDNVTVQYENMVLSLDFVYNNVNSNL